MSLLLSLWCKPILGSSKIYNTPTNWVPIWVASLILWASPPERDLRGLSRLKYVRPKFNNKFILWDISLNIGLAIIFCSPFNFFSALFNQLEKVLMSIWFNSEIFLLLILKCKDSFFNLSPLHTEHFFFKKKSSINSLIFLDFTSLLFFIKSITPWYFTYHNVPGYFFELTATSWSSPYKIISKTSSGISFIGLEISSLCCFKIDCIFLKIHTSLYWPNGIIPPLLILLS